MIARIRKSTSLATAPTIVSSICPPSPPPQESHLPFLSKFIPYIPCSLLLIQQCNCAAPTGYICCPWNTVTVWTGSIVGQCIPPLWVNKWCSVVVSIGPVGCAGATWLRGSCVQLTSLFRCRVILDPLRCIRVCRARESVLYGFFVCFSWLPIHGNWYSFSKDKRSMHTCV